MVRRMIGLVYKEITGLHQAAYVLALFAFGSQILALLRDRLLANEFGAGATLDIYYAAFRIPDLLFVLFASTLSVYVLMPFVAARAKKGDETGASALLAQLATLFLIGYTALAGVIFMLAPQLTNWLFPDITDQALLVLVLRILLIQPLLLGFSTLFGVVTQYHHRFVLFAISPLLYNLGIIFGIVFLYPWVGLSGVAYGVLLGAIGHLLVQWPLVRGSAFRFGLTTGFDWVVLKAVLLVSIPRAVTLSINQIVLLVLVSMASAMTVGSVSVFQFAYNLQSVPLAIIGVSYSVAAFPTLAKLFAGNDMERFQTHIITALRHVLFWSVPVIGLCIVLRAQLVRVILGSGSFNWEDTRLTAAVFALLILSLLAHCINLLLVRAFYAGGNTFTPLWTSFVTALVAITSAYGAHAAYVSNEVFQKSVASALRVSDVAGTEVLVLALVYSLALMVQSILLFVLAGRHFTLPLRTLSAPLLRALFATTCGVVSAYGALQFFVPGLNVETFIGIFLQGLLAGLCGLVGVILGYAVVNSPELHEVSRALSRKIFKTDVIAPQKSVL